MARTKLQNDPCAPARCRECYVPEIGVVRVPRHIVRLDGEHGHGWQVRFRTPSRYFGDHDGSPRTSLAKARAYLRSIYKAEPKQTHRGVSRRSHGDPGRVYPVGVRVLRNQRGHWYAEATPLREGNGSPRRFYIGTDKTRSVERARAAVAKATAARQGWLAAAPIPVR